MRMETAEQYVESLYAEDRDLANVKQGIRDHGMPEISVPPGYGRLLTLLARLSGGGAALEIGALGGYSGICILRGLRQDGKLISLELEQKHAEVAHKHIREAGMGDQAEFRVGEALDSLQQLFAEGHKFDFIFIDADKGNYPNYLEWAIKLSHSGSVITGDNVLMHGKSMNPQHSGPAVAAMRSFNRQIAEDPRLDSTLLPAYDGLAVAVVK